MTLKRIVLKQAFKMAHFYSDQPLNSLITLGAISERPIQQNLISADTDNRSNLPILSADISADNQCNLFNIQSKNGLKKFWTKFYFCKLLEKTFYT